VVDADPKNVRARVLLGRVFFEQKDYHSAKVQFEAAVAQGEFTSVWRLLSLTYLHKCVRIATGMGEVFCVQFVASRGAWIHL